MRLRDTRKQLKRVGVCITNLPATSDRGATNRHSADAQMDSVPHCCLYHGSELASAAIRATDVLSRAGIRGITMPVTEPQLPDPGARF
jgi:hypothetical protein